MNLESKSIPQKRHAVSIAMTPTSTAVTLPLNLSPNTTIAVPPVLGQIKRPKILTEPIKSPPETSVSSSLYPPQLNLPSGMLQTKIRAPPFSSVETSTSIPGIVNDHRMNSIDLQARQLRSHRQSKQLKIPTLSTSSSSQANKLPPYLGKLTHMYRPSHSPKSFYRTDEKLELNQPSPVKYESSIHEKTQMSSSSTLFPNPKLVTSRRPVSTSYSNYMMDSNNSNPTIRTSKTNTPFPDKSKEKFGSSPSTTSSGTQTTIWNGTIYIESSPPLLPYQSSFKVIGIHLRRPEEELPDLLFM
jgi:hypothetical protein